jgi:hypothetical protein
VADEEKAEKEQEQDQGINYNIYEANQRDSEKVETNKNMRRDDVDNIYHPQIGQPIPNSS